MEKRKKMEKQKGEIMIHLVQKVQWKIKIYKLVKGQREKLAEAAKQPSLETVAKSRFGSSVQTFSCLPEWQST